VALTVFKGSWAAAWRAEASDGEYLRARTPTASFGIGPYLAGPDHVRPAIVPIDGSHLLVLFVQGRDDQDAGYATSYTLRGVVLDATAGTAGAPFDLQTPDGSAIEALEVNASIADDAVAVGWRSPAAPGSPLGEDVWLSYWTSVAGPSDVLAPLTPLAVPRSPAHRAGDQRALALAPISNAPVQFLAAWDDLGMSFGAGEGMGDVVLLRLPPMGSDPSVAYDITVDATQLDEQQMQLPGIASFDSKSIQHLSLLPGSYSVYTAGGYVVGASGSLASFTVKSDGTIDYDSSLSQAFSGIHSTTLVINGFSLTVDAHLLNEQQMQVPGVASFDSLTPKPLTVAPGDYSVYTAGGYIVGPSGNLDTVNVKYDGTISKEGSDGAPYTLANRTLGLPGFSLTVDAHSLTEQQMQVPGVASFDSTTPKTLTVAPGDYSVYTAGGYIVGPSGNLDTVNVKYDGTISYDVSLGKAYSLANGTLTLTRFPITVDAHWLREQQMQVPGLASFDSNSVQSLFLAPGWYSVYSAGGYVLGSNNTVSTVQVKTDGTLDYDPSFEGAFTGATSTTLDLKGRGIAVNAMAHPAQLYAVEAVTPLFAGSMVETLQLLPGSYVIDQSSLGDRLGVVTVQAGGTIAYDATYSGVFSGSGTNTVIVR
jgi:hypothetical protein